MTDLDTIAAKIGYRFKKKELIEQALTHKSYGATHNERLEFLGDSVVNFIIAAKLFHLYPYLDEGALTRHRSNLIRKETLAIIAKELSIHRYILLGLGEEKNFGRDRNSILANVVEAIIAAIYLDAGFELCFKVVETWFQSHIAAIKTQGHVKDNKTLLQEFSQSNGLSLPKYTVLAIKGKKHQQEFFVTCSLEELDFLVQGSGSSRRKAEQVAAEKFLKRLNNEK